MSNTVKVGKAKRKHIRELSEPFGKDFNKYLAEIITNCDDSYKRLESSGQLPLDLVKHIDIYISKKEDGFMIHVVDQAEGMTPDKLIEVFTKYGGDNAGGIDVKSRGIFGQGASDVLFNSTFNNFYTYLISVKDEYATKVDFELDNNYDRSITLNSVLEDEKDYLKKRELIHGAFKIKNNGTFVAFGVKSDVFKYTFDTTVRNLENFYTFRYLFSADNREVSIYYEGRKHILSSKNYLFEDSKNILKDKKGTFTFGDFELNYVLNLYKTNLEKHDKTKILVIDENNVVYANDFFKFDNNPKASNFCGTLKIDGFYNLCKFYLNSETEASTILTETRDGLNYSHEFYKTLLDSISPLISKSADEFGKDIKETDLTNNKKFISALNDINKYLKTEIEEEIHGGNNIGHEAPSDGIRFIRTEVFLNLGKKYSLKLLINPQMITPDEDIVIYNNNPTKLKVSPVNLNYSVDEIQNDLVIKSVIIEALDTTIDSTLITAKTKLYTAEVYVNVIEEEIFYPLNGLEFHSDQMRVKKNKTHIASLYVDTSIVPLGSNITLEKETTHINLLRKNLSVGIGDIIKGDIALIKVKYSALSENGDFTLNAKFDDLVAPLDIQVRDIDNPDVGSQGLISSFKLQKGGNTFYQSYFDPSKKIIYIMQENQINTSLIPKLIELNPESPSFSSTEKIIIADILSNQIASILVDKKIEKGKLSFDNGGHEKYLNEMKQEKIKIFLILDKALA